MTYEEERAKVIDEYHRAMDAAYAQRGSTRAEQIGEAIITKFEAGVDLLVSIPPLAWLDRLLSGPSSRNDR